MPNTPIVALATQVVRLPGEDRTCDLLAATALFTAHRYLGRWELTLTSKIEMPGDPRATSIGWLADALPPTGTLIGWRLADVAIPWLLSAARDAGDPLAAAAMLKPLLTLSANSVDLAVPFGGSGAPSFHRVCHEACIVDRPITHERGLKLWQADDRPALRDVVEARAVALWRLWARTHGEAEAITETGDWLAGRDEPWARSVGEGA